MRDDLRSGGMPSLIVAAPGGEGWVSEHRSPTECHNLISGIEEQRRYLLTSKSKCLIK